MEFIYCGKVNVKETELGKFNKILKNLRIESMRSMTHALKPEATNEVIKIKEEAVDDDDLVRVAQEEGEIPDFSEGSDDEYQPPGKRQCTASGSTSNYYPNISHPYLLPSDPGFQKKRIKIDDVVKNEEHKMWLELRPEICPFCNKKAKTQKHRNEHVKYCSQNPDRVVSNCPFCAKSFCDPYYVRKHCKNTHAEMLLSNSSNGDFSLE